MRELELYIHIPFCVKKCAYCDFLSGAASEERKHAYYKALLQEIRACGDYGEYLVTSVFFGGGTPSILPGEWIGTILSELKQHFPFQEEAEITIEANPGTLDREKLVSYRAAGVNRISLGCQSADDRELQLLGRIHTWEDVLESYRLVREAGFENVNLDLMSALPGQTVESWKDTLQKVIALGPEHISAYSLIIEEGTPFYDMQDKLMLPKEEDERQMYADTARILLEHGYEQYEISNYAKAGKRCRHNIGYWIGREYLGLGLGASSYLQHTRFHNVEDMDTYLEYSAQPKRIRADIHELSVQEEMEEYMILGLRMTEGVSRQGFRERFRKNMEEVYGDVLKTYTETGHLILTDHMVRFSEKGVSVSNRILAEFLF